MKQLAILTPDLDLRGGEQYRYWGNAEAMPPA
jgi:hypothetical protein